MLDSVVALCQWLTLHYLQRYRIAVLSHSSNSDQSQSCSDTEEDDNKHVYMYLRTYNHKCIYSTCYYTIATYKAIHTVYPMPGEKQCCTGLTLFYSPCVT